MKIKPMNVMAGVAGVGGCLLASAAANAAIVGLSTSLVDFSGGYVLASGSIALGTTASVGTAWASFDADWDVYRLWATVDSALTTVGAVGGSVDNSFDLCLSAGDGGVFYNHPVLDSDTSQVPFLFNAFPTAAFDTFAAMGAADGSSPPMFFDPKNGFDGFQSSVVCQNCGWSTIPSAGEGVVSDGNGGLRFLLGQFTVTEGSEFSAQMRIVGGGQDVFASTKVPAPGVMVLLVVGGVVGGRRRRR